MDISKIIKQFDSWYNSNQERMAINYNGAISYSKLKGMADKKFITFFKEFCYAGGGIQSGGKRNKERFEQYLLDNTNKFKMFILEPFSKKFDLESWFNRIRDHKHFGVGLATIYLNYIDSATYPILNNKTINALNKLEYDISTTLNFSNYLKVREIQENWIKTESKIVNYEKADALCHFVIGEQEGINLINKLISQKKESIIANSEQEELFKQIDTKLNDDDLLELIKNNEQDKHEYIIINSKRYKRSNYLMTLIKIHRGFNCQFCGESIVKEDGSHYIEACHIIAKAEGGKDILENIIVLCPNHHKLFDLGKKTIIKHNNKELTVKINEIKYEASLT